MPLIHPLIHDWNADAPPVRAGRDAGRRDAAGRIAVAVGPHAGDRREDRSPASGWTSSGSTRRTSGCRARGRTSRRRRAAGAIDRRSTAEDHRQLRGAHGHRDIRPIAEIGAADRRADRVLRVHRIESDPAVRRGLDDRFPAEVHRRGDRVRGQGRPHGDVRHRGHDARRPGVAARAVHDGDARRGVAAVHRRHGRPRDADRRAGGRAFRPRSGRRARVGGRHRLARPSRSRVRRRSSVAALEAGATRLHGTALGIGERCGNTPIDLLLVNLVMSGVPRSRSVDAARLLRGGLTRMRRADPGELPGRRPRRVPDRHRRARGSGRQGVQKEGSRADGCGLRVRARDLVGRAAADRRRARCPASRTSFTGSKAAGLPATDDIVDRIFTAAKASNRTLTPSRFRASSTRRSRARHEGTPGTTKNSKNALTQTKC